MDSKPVLLFSADKRVVGASTGSEAVLGRPDEALVGLQCKDALICPDCNGDACPLQQALSGTTAEGYLPNDGRPHPFSISASPLQGVTGSMALVEIRTPETDEVSMSVGLQPVLDGLRELFESDLAALAFYNESAREIRWQVTSGNLSTELQSIRLRPGQGFAGRIVLTDLPLRSFRFPHDLTRDPGSYPIFLAEELQAAMGVPVRGRGRILGVLMVGSRQPRSFSEADVDVLIRTADSISMAAEMMSLHGEAIRRERAKLALEVHDGLAQNLFGLRLLLRDVQDNLFTDSLEAIERGLGEVHRVLEGMMGELRRLIADLRGSTQMPMGLLTALSEHLATFYRLSGLQVELAIRLNPGEEIPCQDPHAALRIVQEALMNVHRHAMAHRVQVEVERVDLGFCITVTDDGRGFDTGKTVGGGHYGLSMMRERAEAFQGSLEIESSPGLGTRVSLRIPV